MCDGILRSEPGARPATSPSAGGQLRVTRLTAAPAALGESPVWDPRSQCLWWIDGVAGKIMKTSWGGETVRSDEIFTFDEHVGCVALATDGCLITSLEHSIQLVDPSHPIRLALLLVEDFQPDTRLNDGKTDRQGRFVYAGMSRSVKPKARLHRIDRARRREIIAEDLSIGNGIAFSPQGDTLYFSDTPARRIYACDYDGDSGSVSEPRLHIDTAPWGSGADGATVDEAGHLWVALIHAGKIARFDPSGRLVGMINAPVDLPSSLCFGGPGMGTLFVTSIRDSGTGRAVSRHPEGGHLFAIEGLGVRGIPETPFGLHA